MDALRKIGIAALILSALGLVACSRSNSGSAERAGNRAGSAMQSAGSAVGSAAANAGSAVGSAAESTGTALTDTAITAKVKAAILAKPGLRIMQINVDTTHGVVTLTGTVRSQQDSDRAAAVVGNIDGVRSVNNQLTVKPNGSG